MLIHAQFKFMLIASTIIVFLLYFFFNCEVPDKL